MNEFAAMDLLAFLVLLIIFLTIMSDWSRLKKSTRIFCLILLIILFGITADFFAILFNDDPRIDGGLMLFFSVMFGCIASPVYAYYCVSVVNEEKEILSTRCAKIILFAHAAAMLFGTFCFIKGDLIDVVDGTLSIKSNIMVIFCTEILSTFFLMTVLAMHVREIRRRDFVTMILYAALPFAATVIEGMHMDISISYVAVALSAIIQYAVIQSRRISEAELREKIVDELSKTDPLTGLKNRRAFSEYIEALDDVLDAGVIFFDMNGLKYKNDNFGHAEGDKYLIQFANFLAETLAHAEIFRISGDEFVAIYRGANKKELFTKETDNMRDVIDDNNDIAAMGACFDFYVNITDLINRAEKNMYESKDGYYLRTGRMGHR